MWLHRRKGCGIQMHVNVLFGTKLPLHVWPHTVYTHYFLQLLMLGYKIPLYFLINAVYSHYCKLFANTNVSGTIFYSSLKISWSWTLWNKELLSASTNVPRAGRGGTQLSFWYMCVAQRAEQRGLWMYHCQIWDPSELNFWANCSLVNWILAQFEVLEHNSFPILRHWSLQLLKICDLGVKVGFSKLKKCSNGGLANGEEGMKWGTLGLHNTCTPYFNECPPGKYTFKHLHAAINCKRLFNFFFSQMSEINFLWLYLASVWKMLSNEYKQALYWCSGSWDSPIEFV